MGKRVWVLMVGIMILLSGCASISGSKIIIEERELKNNQNSDLQILINYDTPSNNIQPMNFHIQFITSKNLQIRKNNNVVEEDVAYDVIAPTFLNYTLRATGVYSGQEVETVEVVITSNDNKLSERIVSDFIVITR